MDFSNITSPIISLCMLFFVFNITNNVHYVKMIYKMSYQQLIDFLYYINGNVLDEYCEHIENEPLQVKDTIENSEKYEDKYLQKFRVLPNEFFLTQEERDMENEKFQEFFLQECELLKNNKKQLQEELFSYQDELEKLETSEESSKINSIIFKLQEQLVQLNNKIITDEEVQEKVQSYIVNQHLDKLANSVIIEKTPLGNVIMFYNNKKDVFEFHSDNTIPYRFLETVARKYVITYFCKPLYVDMESELKDSEQKMVEKEEREKEKKRKIDEERKELSGNGTGVNGTGSGKEKSVFAKFKSYNKEGTGGRVVSGAPPKNSIPNKNNIGSENTDLDAKIILKERSNRYSYQGKIVNFNILKKVDKKVVNKKFAMSFADFKKSIICEK